MRPSATDPFEKSLRGRAMASGGDGLIGRADVLFAEERLLVEVDGFEHHAVSEFQRDRTRQNRLVHAGCSVLRFTWADLVDRPQMVADRIRTMLLALAAR